MPRIVVALSHTNSNSHVIVKVMLLCVLQSTPQPTAVKPVPPPSLLERIQEIHLDIARRGFEFLKAMETLSLSIGIIGSRRKPNCFIRRT